MIRSSVDNFIHGLSNENDFVNRKENQFQMEKFYRMDSVVEGLEPGSFGGSWLRTLALLFHVEVLLWPHQELSILISIEVLLLRCRLLLDVFLDFCELEE